MIFSVAICELTGSESCSARVHDEPNISLSRYNLKRRVASLPPISSEIFAEKVLNAQASSSAVAAKASFEKNCSACQKTYYSENAFQNHLGSQKHRLRSAIIAKDGGASLDDETASVMSSTISLGEPINTPSRDADSSEPATKDIIDAEAEAEFSEVVNGIKETSLVDHEEAPKTEPVSRRPSRPHHSAHEKREEHPLSPQKDSNANDLSDIARKPADSSKPINRCLFCNYDSPSLKLNVMHMTKFHGMFIPEQNYLTDLDGLITWLNDKVIEAHECLYCHKLKGSVESIQTHMRDKGHCMIAFESEGDMIDVGQFYDFSSTYSDGDYDEDIMEDIDEEHENDIKGGARRVIKAVISDANGDQEMADGQENADGWETDSSESSLDSADLTAVPIDHKHAYERLPLHRHHSHNDPRPHRALDGFHSHAHSHHAAFHSDHELHLPSGRTAGHRSLARYYRQNLHSYLTPAEQSQQRLIENGTDANGDAQMTDSNTRGREITRANGGQGMLGVTDAKKREVRQVERRETKRAQRAQKQYQWGVDKRGNSQKHFRDPLLQ